MRFFHKYLRLSAAVLVTIAAVAVGRASLPPWAGDAVAASALESALFRSMHMPDGDVFHLRPPAESRSNLSTLLNQKASAELYRVRAHEDERAGDYAAAEADWRASAQSSQDAVTALGELADFYGRRVQPQKQLAALLRLGALPAAGREQWQAPERQAQWLSFAKAVTVADQAQLSPAQHASVYQAWIARYSKSVAPYQAYLDWTLAQHDRTAATQIAGRLKAAFPQDLQLAITTDAEVAAVQEGNAAGLAVYGKNFSHLWPDTLRTKCFSELTQAHQLRTFLGDAQAAATANANDLTPVSRIFYQEAQNHKGEADAQLLRFVSAREARRSAWTPEEMKILAALFLRVNDYDESARFNYALYGSAQATGSDRELGLASIIALLLDVPEQPLAFGNRDLSLYQNIAGMDRHPGFLNGVLTVALNSTYPAEQYATASQTASSYFHRASASRLLDKFRAEFANSSRIPDLEAKLFAAYAVYAQDDALMRDVPPWLTRNPTAPAYIDTAMLLADAYVRGGKTADELALYSRLLQTLSLKSGHMPIGDEGVVPIASASPVAADEPSSTESAASNGSGARVPDYARVLDRYLSRLVQLNRPFDAVALLRKEIDSNPDDAGLYQRLALFVEQNNLVNDLEQTYKQALARFKDLSWANKLARFYLRRKQLSEYGALTRRITDTFAGSELSAFLSNVSPSSPVLFRQVNLYAHKRFPHAPVFVHNLLQAYTTKATRDPAAYEQLLRENWFNDPDLRARYLESLSRTGGLHDVLAALPAPAQAESEKNLAALELRAEALTWLTDYEAAAPVLVQLASAAVGDRDANARALTAERSLAGAGDLAAFESATRLAKQDVTASPGDLAAITLAGEIDADRDRYAGARPWWNRLASVRPGSEDGYLQSATVFWDYFQFDDALHSIAAGRQALNKPTLFGYEAGAIHERRGRYPAAVGEYLQAAMHDGSQAAQDRLLQLAKRQATGSLVEQETASLVSQSFDEPRFKLRLAILESQNRRADMGTLLARMVPIATTTGDEDVVREAAVRLGSNETATAALGRKVALTKDPIEKLGARLELARWEETHGQSAEAGQQYASLLADEPNRLGVVRAVVDYQWRQKQTGPAVQILTAAASRAQSPFQAQLWREAGEKATQSGQYNEARRLLDQLLQSDPYNGDLLAGKASTYAREGDTRGLTAFYSAELKSFADAPLAPAAKTERVAALRRGYIQALTTEGQFTEALEQYQLVLNAYPEDDGLAAEVAGYAEAHQLTSRAIGYYEKAATDAPRDYRWPLVLARLQTRFNHYSEAIAAYDKAGTVRPDRADILSAKADLQLRLLRFADANQSYKKLYELSYHDTQYLAKEADATARLGDKSEALRLLRAAYIEPHPGEPNGYVTAMAQAQTWRMFDAVHGLFQELHPMLAAEGAPKQQALNIEIQSLAALHRVNEGMALVSNDTKNNAEAQTLVQLLGETAANYLTPTEKSSLASSIAQPNGLPPRINGLLFARALQFRQLEADLLLQQAQSADRSQPQWSQYERLQSSRLLYAQLGRQLEALGRARHRELPLYRAVMRQAYLAYEKAGDSAGQVRLLTFSGGEFARLFVGMGGDLNRRINDLAAHDPDRANAVGQHQLNEAPARAAVGAIAARGQQLSPLWTKSYTALAGLYFLTPESWASQAFDSALGPRTVNAELTSKASFDSLRGPDWFYYAGRYGEYLQRRNSSDEDGYLLATVEADPAASNSYVALGDEHRELKQAARAARSYRDGLELSPNRADIHDRLGMLAEAEGQHAEALKEWREALSMLAGQVEAGPLPQEYWSTARALLAHLNHAKAFPELKPEANSMLEAYLKRNGIYQFDPFLEGLFAPSADRGLIVPWMVQLSRTSGASGLIGLILSRPGLVPDADKDALYKAEIARTNASAPGAAGYAGGIDPTAVDERKQTAIDYAQYLDGQKRWTDEWSVLQAMTPASDRPLELVLRAGVLSGHLRQLLAGYLTEPDATPTADQVLSEAAVLRRKGHADLALQLEEFEYKRELASSSPSATAYFGMARVRFAQNRTGEGLTLIRNVTLGVGEPFSNLPTAVETLESVGLTKEASEYADQWRRAEPWNQEAILAAARLTGDTKSIDTVRSASATPYSLRVKAAELLHSLRSPATGIDELALLTQPAISPVQTRQPFAVEARLQAAAQTTSPADKVHLYSEAIAIDPSSHEPRLQLAEAAFHVGQDALAIASFESYRSAEIHDSPIYLTVEQKVADAHLKRGEPNSALDLYNDLFTRTSDAAKRADLSKTRDALKAQITLQAANLQRVPSVTKEIKQATLVKPKLTALPGDAEEEQ